MLPCEKSGTASRIQVNYSKSPYVRNPTSRPGCPPTAVIILRAEQLWNLNSNFRQGRCIRIDNEKCLLPSPWLVRLSARIRARPMGQI